MGQEGTEYTTQNTGKPNNITYELELRKYHRTRELEILAQKQN